MPINLRQNKQLTRPDKDYFMLWYELGTVPKVISHLALAGEVNPKTGKPFSITAIMTAAYRYTLENPTEAKEYYEKTLGRELKQQEWEEFLCYKAMKVYYGVNSLRSWVKRHSMEKYQYIWGKRFPNGQLD